MFMGKYNNSIDAKNRMIIPAKHRDQLGGRCVVTKGIDTCLYIYSLSEWEKEHETLSQLPKSDKSARKHVRNTFSNAEECEIDKQGRILIPAELKKMVHIEKELVTVGAMRVIEVWSKEVWENPEDYESEENPVDDLLKYNY